MSYQLVYQDPFNTIDTTKWEVHTDAYQIVEITTDPTNANNNVLRTVTQSGAEGDIGRVVWIGSTLTKPTKIRVKSYNVDVQSKSNSICIARDAQGNIYMIFINPAQGWAKIVYVNEAELATTPPTELASFDITTLGISMNQWYTVEIELLENNTIIIRINDTEVGQYQHTSELTPYIHLGAVEGGETLYDDFELYQVQQVQVNDMPLTDVAYVEEQEIVQNPHFTIIDYTQSVTVPPSSSFNVSVTVQNDGTADGDVTIRLKDPQGNIVDSRTVTIAAGGQSSVTLSAIAPSQAGTYTYTVEAFNETTQTVDDSKTVTVNVSQVAPAGAAAPSAWWILAILIILLLLLLLLRRRQEMFMARPLFA